MKDITEILEIIIKVVIALGGVFITPWLIKKFGVETLRKWTEIVCDAAEEAARSGLIPKAEKYEYAVKLLKKFLGIFGWTIDSERIRALIDAMCYEKFNQFKDDVGDEE